MSKSNQFANISIGLCCVVVTALALWREFRPDTVVAGEASRRSTYVTGWEHLLAPDATVGPASASLRVVEFVDFECPFCAELAARLTRLQQQYPGALSLSLRHYPIPGHKFARKAALAFECAKRQHRGETMYAALFSKQDSLGLRSFNEYARDAGVGSLDGFTACVDSSTYARVDEDVGLAERLGVRATPTLVVNGWLLPFPPSEEQFKEMIDSHRSGRSWRPENGDTLNVKW